MCVVGAGSHIADAAKACRHPIQSPAKRQGAAACKVAHSSKKRPVAKVSGKKLVKTVPIGKPPKQYDGMDGFLFALAALLALTVLAGLLGGGCALFGGALPWLFWQFVIGVVGGGWLALALGVLCYLLDDAFVCSYAVFLGIMLGLVGLVNVLLFALCGGGYTVIFICLSVWLIVGGVSYACVAFDDLEEGVGAFAVVETIVALLELIIGLLCFA